jgi:hypothetical protein
MANWKSSRSTTCTQGGGEPAPPVGRYVGRIEDVAGPQHGVHRELIGHVEDLAHNLEARACQFAAVVAIELAELEAQVQVCSVKDPEHHTSPAIVKRTSRMGTSTGGL